jgi:hypothetical protein
VSELCCVFSMPLLHLQHSVARFGCTDFFQATPSTTLHLIPPPPLGAPNFCSFPSLVTSHSSHRGHIGGTSGPTRPFKVERTPRCPPRSVMCPSGNSHLDRPSDHSWTGHLIGAHSFSRICDGHHKSHPARACVRVEWFLLGVIKDKILRCILGTLLFLLEQLEYGARVNAMLI